MRAILAALLTMVACSAVAQGTFLGVGQTLSVGFGPPMTRQTLPEEQIGQEYRVSLTSLDSPFTLIRAEMFENSSSLTPFHSLTHPVNSSPIQTSIFGSHSGPGWSHELDGILRLTVLEGGPIVLHSATLFTIADVGNQLAAYEGTVTFVPEPGVWVGVVGALAFLIRIPKPQ